ncbi:cytochrome c oxidase assembly protein [Pseudoxanthomonas suwonensis]|uniref:cytochrome c oxidase assembly protein n=1 Tax=Pseudoxanthomonas suwonensis TaxID=314722 RepID=UPI001E3B9C16|nr:cytochrome c oxidase assembly protein [Pseudoxanthomonas suwonensis]
MQQLEPEVHARFLAGRIARKATRPRAKQAWAAAVGAAVLLPLPALALPVCRPPGSLAEPWAPPGAWLLPPALLLALYLAGLWRLWRRAPGRGITPLEAAGFVAGILLLAFVLGGPLNAYARWSLGAHMAQHMLLLAVVPPLLLAGRAWAAISLALPRAVAGGLHRLLHPASTWLAARLGPATVAHAAVMVLWHLPGSLQAALASERLHEAMHASFLLAGLWFWSALWRRIRGQGAGPAPGVVATVSLMMVMGFLGALLTFAPRPLYPLYGFRAPEVGLEALADQQLAGLLMWVPSCLPYLAGALWLTWRGLGRAGRAVRRPAAGLPGRNTG